MNTIPPYNSSRVFVVQEKDIDFTKATRFGKLTPLLPKLHNITMSTMPVFQELKRKMRDFNDTDFILPVGDPVAIMLVALAAAEVNGGRMNVLKWDKKTNEYYEVKVKLYNRRD